MREAECVVDGALALVLRISRCAGVAPLRVRTESAGRRWRITVSPSLVLLQRIIMTALNMTALAALVLDFREESNRRIRVGETAVSAFVWIFDMLLVMAIATLAAYCGSARMENLMRILKQLQQISRYTNAVYSCLEYIWQSVSDRERGQTCGVYRRANPDYSTKQETLQVATRIKINIVLCNDSCTKTEEIGTVVVVCVLTLAVLVQFAEVYLKIQDILDNGFNWSIMVMYSVYYVAKLLELLAVMQWGFTAVAVHAAAAALNHQIQRCHANQFTADELQSTIRLLALSHERIGQMMRQMDAGNGVFIMAVLLSTFLHLVVTPYYLLLRLSSNEGLVKTVIVQVCWGILHMATLLLTVEPCHWTQEQRETTKYLLSRLMVQLSPTSLVSRELDHFAKQTMLTKVNFAPLGIVTLSRPCTAAMLVNVTTYLLILLQFQQVSDHN